MSPNAEQSSEKLIHLSVSTAINLQRKLACEACVTSPAEIASAAVDCLFLASTWRSLS